MKTNFKVNMHGADHIAIVHKITGLEVLIIESTNNKGEHEFILTKYNGEKIGQNTEFESFEELCKHLGEPVNVDNWVEILSGDDASNYIEYNESTEEDLTLYDLKKKVELGEAVEVCYTYNKKPNKDSHNYNITVFAIYVYNTREIYVTNIKYNEPMRCELEVSSLMTGNICRSDFINSIFNDSETAVEIYKELIINKHIVRFKNIIELGMIFIGNSERVTSWFKSIHTGKTLSQLIKEWEKKNKPVTKRIVKEVITTEREVSDIELGDNTLDRLEEMLVNIVNKLKENNEDNIEQEYTVHSLEFTRKEIMGVDVNKILDIIDIDNTLLITSEPGTGKSTLMKELAYLLTYEGTPVEYGQKAYINRTLQLSFNPETSYVSTIGGIQCDNGIWKNKDGSLKKFFDVAAKDLEHTYVVILDEINRVSSISSVLGEIISAMEQRDEYITTNMGTELVVPRNIVFLAAMNTFDSSVINLDRAIRDRFSLFEMSNISAKAEYIKPKASDELKDTLQRCLDKFAEINKILAKHPMMKSENKVGLRHFYRNYNTIYKLGLIVNYRIIPQIIRNTDGLEDYDIDKINKLIKELMEICEERD